MNGEQTPTRISRTKNAVKNAVRDQPSSSVMGSRSTLGPQIATPEPIPDVRNATPTITQP